jgi:hypothetical protein
VLTRPIAEVVREGGGVLWIRGGVAIAFNTPIVSLHQRSGRRE